MRIKMSERYCPGPRLIIMSRFLFCPLLFVMFSVNAQSAVVTFQSATERTALLELYTSEGCSSCPPAEAWLSGLKKSPGLWKDFVPLAFHVDYWDYLGWRDPWAERGFSDRQRAYAENWHNENVYTPAFAPEGFNASFRPDESPHSFPLSTN